MFPVFPDYQSVDVDYYYRTNYYTTTRVFDVCDRMVCINITLFDDDILESFDLILVLLITYQSLISHNVSGLFIEVQDDDDSE